MYYELRKVCITIGECERVLSASFFKRPKNRLAFNHIIISMSVVGF